jgi:uncharacterized protein YkwD
MLNLNRMNTRYALITLFIITLTSCSTTSVTEDEELFETETASKVVVELSAQEQELFDMVNDYRVSQGLNILEFDAASYEFALEHNEYMISKGQLSHDHFNARASKVSKVTAANYVAENVAKDYQLIDDALSGWLSSTPHRNTIEGDFTHSTISIERDAEGNPYYTQIFFRK